MPVMIGRRRLLVGAASLLAVAAAPRRARGAALSITASADTGNEAMVPAALEGGLVHFAGESFQGAVDAQTWATVWREPVPADAPCRFRPRCADGIVVCGGGAMLAARDAASGRLLWQARPAKAFGAPLLHGGQVLCGDGNLVVARGLRDGRIAWTFAAVADTDVAYAPAATGDTVFVGPGDGRLYALSARDGSPRWTVDGREDWQYLRQMDIAGDVLVAGTYKERLLGLSIADGRRTWSVNAGNFINSQHVADGHAYFWSPTGWVFAVNAATGAILWRHRTTDYTSRPGNWAPVMAELVTAGTVLYALDMADVLHCLDQRTGQEIGRYPVDRTLRPFVVPLEPATVALGTTRGALVRCAMAVR
ncbi:MAG: PQQ-binding-like beta-propeller repeat protein [Rhodospirillaceae bacterium]